MTGMSQIIFELGNNDKEQTFEIITRGLFSGNIQGLSK